MRFCDLFISYKIGLKSIKSTIPFTKLPLYRKIFVIIFFASAIISGILLIFKQTWASYIPMALGIISLIIFFIIYIHNNSFKIWIFYKFIDIIIKVKWRECLFLKGIISKKRSKNLVLCLKSNSIWFTKPF